MLHVVYAYGFASGPLSSKGQALAAHFAARGIHVGLLDLRVPDAHRLRLSAMVEAISASVLRGVPILAVGSSLGGIAVARAAEVDSRIVGALLLAPAFRIAERWRTRLGEVAWQKWKDEGVMPYEDHSTGGTLVVDFAFIEDADRVDGGGAFEPAAPTHAWPHVTIPTVIIQGRQDAVVDPELSRTFARGRPNVELIEVDDEHQLRHSVQRMCDEADRLYARLA